MSLLHPTRETWAQFDPATRKIFQSTVQFFETKGKRALKKEDHEVIWYTDFLDFLKREHVFHYFLTPSAYGDSTECRWDSARNTAYSEILGFYSLSHWYTWQVSILGLGPIWMSKNEEIKKKTAAKLKDGGIFAFGLSEKEHGADLIGSDMMLVPKDGAWIAQGDKYYIGNGNCAAYVSVFGKTADRREEFVFFAVESNHPKYECTQNVVRSQKYVAEFILHDYPITDKEILSRGRDAWDASLATVAFAKFNLGLAAIGICTHAYYEAINHAAARKLYGTFVTDFPHIRQLFTEAYARLEAMRFFAYRAKDYMKNSSASDRRYLLFNPMVKMKVTMQGEEVINLLWDVIAARGFEKDMYFESAARDIRMLPKLEGTAHVNMVLVIKFMMNYMFETQEYAAVPENNGPSEDAFLFAQGSTTKGLEKVIPGDYSKVYGRFSSPNLNLFKSQMEDLKAFLSKCASDKEQSKDLDFMLTLGEIFTLVAYGQLVLEQCEIEIAKHSEKKAELEDLIDLIFDFMVRDFSKHAVTLYGKPSATAAQVQ
ncbi:MAG TPA: acyl-CoA dehydrogenase, partial [Leptospiraceae bacterium]|nr:acyl-CoA dehydrogenase [Leptospiraceae bacterium]